MEFYANSRYELVGLYARKGWDETLTEVAKSCTSRRARRAARPSRCGVAVRLTEKGRHPPNFPGVHRSYDHDIAPLISRWAKASNPFQAEEFQQLFEDQQRSEPPLGEKPLIVLIADDSARSVEDQRKQAEENNPRDVEKEDAKSCSSKAFEKRSVCPA